MLSYRDQSCTAEGAYLYLDGLFEWKINLGTVLHLAALVIVIIRYFGRVERRLTIMETKSAAFETGLERVEHALNNVRNQMVRLIR